MNACAAASAAACPSSAIQIATGRAISSVTRDDRDRRPAVARTARRRSAASRTRRRSPSLTISTMSSARSSKCARRSGRRMPSVIAHTNTAMKPVAVRRQRRHAVGARTRRRARRATAGAPGSLGQPPPRGSSSEASEARSTIPKAKPSVTSCSTKRHHTKSSSSAPQRGREGEHGGQREPVVETGLEVQRVADEARHARVGHDARGEHRVGRREQRAEQERLGPARSVSACVGQRDDRAR